MNAIVEGNFLQDVTYDVDFLKLARAQYAQLLGFVVKFDRVAEQHTLSSHNAFICLMNDEEKRLRELKSKPEKVKSEKKASDEPVTPACASLPAKCEESKVDTHAVDMKYTGVQYAGCTHEAYRKASLLFKTKDITVALEMFLTVIEFFRGTVRISV